MDNRTVINPDLQYSSATVINSDIAEKNDSTIINPAIQYANATVINRDIVEEYNRQNNLKTSGEYIAEGTVVCEKYTIKSQMEVSSGEADLYLCSDGSNLYAAKIYRRKFAVKQDVVDALMKIDSPYVARLYTTGNYNGYPVEIIPYYENGSLQGHTFTEEELTDMIIPAINEGLKAIHDAGIIHKDLKPSNIMLNSDGKSVSIIDFGISSFVSDGSTVLVTKTGMTPEYSAPETFRNLFLKESDYYSFGITLYELFCGYTPYANMQPEEIEQFLSVQHIPYPEKMSDRLKDFISALTYYDISNRNNKNNPNRRWTYEEVKCWTEGENLVIPGEGIGNSGSSSVPGYEFYGEVYTNPDLLVSALAEHWEEGKKQLFRGNITSYFRKWNMEIARKCQAAEETAARENGKDDIIFWKLLYKINPRLKSFVWMGKSYENLAAFGREILEKLWDNDTSAFSYYSDILSEKVLSQYVQMIYPKNEKLNKVVAAIEDSYELERNNGTDFMRTYYLMAFSLSGQKLFLLDGNQFRTVGELAAYLRKVSEESFGQFEEICHRLVDYDGNLDIQLETWLLSLGKSEEIEKWKSSMND